MFFQNIVAFAFFWLMNPILCMSAPTNQAPTNLKWEGRLTEDGPNATFAGRSISEITSHIKRVAPWFVWPELLIHPQPRHAQPPVKKSQHRMLCDKVTSGYANYNDVLDQTAQLQAMSGFCRVSPTLKGQPLSCNRLTCANGSAVFLCNHSDNHDSISTCARVGQYAQQIIEWCYDGKDPNVKGQIYDGDYWSVMVHADNC
ncbi:hypothetical protein NUW58_g4232 [Xylaria curta]|uniref:Uncharacterized protein n=1 Tax=Xylaria curta TaxID=42375 RepID=A0ACC1P9L5_9PEZI|nr:hypothetical protein NUW58_g4232 [Xylaria curta]